MFDSKNRYIIENYSKKSTFSSFLAGISGVFGIPMWCFYVNRGQGVASFGIENKDYSIMEFFPAHQSYQNTKNNGFRTFIKVDNEFYEPFHSNSSNVNTKMYIGMNELEIEEVNKDLNIQINVLYYTLPNENLGGLVRNVSIKNIGDTSRNIELVDGMPAIIPYGITLQSLKETAQTMKAWMQVEDIDMDIPYYRVRVSTADSAVVSKVEGGNFMVTTDENGNKLNIIADPELMFKYNYDFEVPVGFVENSVDFLLKEKQILQNQIPCGFACTTFKLESGNVKKIYTTIGQGKNKETVHNFANKKLDSDFYSNKNKDAISLVDDLGSMINTESGNKLFDLYCKQTYLDNVLRGGFPIEVGEKLCYVYSRKHGDIERDYNFFSMLPEFFSQGNGNFRDINQNRRSDILFSPFVKDYNIKMFYNLIQLDGYNPLAVKQVSYVMNNVDKVLAKITSSNTEKLKELFNKSFSIGKVFEVVNDDKLQLSCPNLEFLETVLENSTEEFNADFQEGYWTDHWTYNLDLIESYVSIYPEKEKDLLFNDNDYTYYESKGIVLPRKERYVKTENGVRQYLSVDEHIKSDITYNEARTSEDKIYKSNLMTKLLVLFGTKFTTLDAYGMGIEMEGGKPGWYDALNGLAGIFGSSMAETYELKRLLIFIVNSLEKYNLDIEVYGELSDLIDDIKIIMDSSKNKDSVAIWNDLNKAKEKYREKINYGIKGELKTLTCEYTKDIVQNCLEYVNKGINRALEIDKKGIPTYFAYSFSSFDIDKEDNIIHKDLEVITLPLFLEGSARYFKITSNEEKEKLYNNVKNSDLYDKKLNMYKVNANLENASFEIGRAKAFSRGWLENESIWLHMEYKYLLELIKNNLYSEYFQAFKDVTVPFLDDKVYGRSPLENSSFIVSSANLDEKLHGRGFVARLSGSTAEFVQMWQIMMFGDKLFTKDGEDILFNLAPAIPKYLIDDNNKLTATLFGKTQVEYTFSKKEDIIPNKYIVKNIKLYYNDDVKEIELKEFKNQFAFDVRDGKINKIKVDVVVL